MKASCSKPLSLRATAQRHEQTIEVYGLEWSYGKSKGQQLGQVQLDLDYSLLWLQGVASSLASREAARQKSESFGSPKKH